MFSFPQLCVYQITFCPNVCHDGCITIISPYRSAIHLLFTRKRAHLTGENIKQVTITVIPNGYRLFGVIVVLTSRIQDYFILLYFNWQ